MTNTVAWKERKVNRYFWNGKGYSTRTACAKAIAKKEAVIWCATHFKHRFPLSLPVLIDENLTGAMRGVTSWMIALAFANIGSNGDRFYYGNHVHYGCSPWHSFLKRRVNHLLAGDEPLIVRNPRDEYNEWMVRDVRMGLTHHLPLAQEAVDGKVFESAQDVHFVLHSLYSGYVHDWMSDYEKRCLFSPLDLLLTKMESGGAQ